MTVKTTWAIVLYEDVKDLHTILKREMVAGVTYRVYDDGMLETEEDE